jgi:monofunctional biosynthetic peptidoglycan transglycosylase
MRLDLAAIDWQIINDGVMGGLSRSAVDLDDHGLSFHGSLSTANRGGFASVRGRLPDPQERICGFRLQVSGDGRRYQFRLRESADSGDIAWRAFFDTGEDTRAVSLSLEEFEPVIRGRRVEVLPSLVDRPVNYIGLMLTSKQPGPFSLRVHSIEILQNEQNGV